MNDMGLGVFSSKCSAGHKGLPLSAPGLILSTHSEVEGPLTSAPFQTRVEPDWVSSWRNLSDKL